MPIEPAAAPNKAVLFGFDTPAEDEEARVHEDPPPNEVQMPHRVPRWAGALLGLLAGLVIGFGAWAMWPEPDTLSQADVDDAIAEALAVESDSSVANLVYRQIAPSVVTVRVLPADPNEAATIGAGVVINEQGQILTATHLLANAHSIELFFTDGQTSTATIVSSDQSTDTAVLSADEPVTLVPAVIGNSRTAQIGDPVFAVGSPLGFTNSLSAGVISGLNRSIPLPGASDDESEITLDELLQFDAMVTQGNSGGPLLNADGHVIGIVSALAIPTDQGPVGGLGFAVPIDIAARAGTDGPSQ